MRQIVIQICILVIISMILTGCVGEMLQATDPTQFPTSDPINPTQTASQSPSLPPPLMEPPTYTTKGISSGELLEKLEVLPNPMGSKDVLKTILCNSNIESLQEEIHRAVYTYYAAEPDKPEDVYETIELYFHPHDYCKRDAGKSCPINGYALKLRVRILYRSDVWTQNDFALDGYEIVSESPLTFKGILRNGSVTQFYYFLNDHYVCLLSVDTEYMDENSHVVEQFQKFLLSIGQSNQS